MGKLTATQILESLQNGTFSYDSLLNIAQGNVPGHSTVVVRGHNPLQTAASGFVDIAEFGNLEYLATAELIDIVSDSTADSIAGIGTQKVIVQGVANDGSALNEIVELDGTTPVSTTGAYLRVNHLIGDDVGAEEFNLGTITGTAASASTLQAQIPPLEGISQNSHYTVPLDAEFYVIQVELNATKDTSGQLPIAEFRGYARQGGSSKTWLQLFDKKLDTNVTNELQIPLAVPARAIQRTDIRFRTTTDKDDTETRVRYYGILIQQ